MCQGAFLQCVRYFFQNLSKVEMFGEFENAFLCNNKKGHPRKGSPLMR